MGAYLPSLCHHRFHQLRGEDKPIGRRLPFLGGTVLGSFGNQDGSFIKDPWLILRDLHLDVSNSNMIVHDFRTSHINFIQNEYIKLDETY